jgi:hypothetical protein
VVLQFVKVILLALTAMGLNFDELRGFHEKHATWKLGTISEFA